MDTLCTYITWTLFYLRSLPWATQQAGHSHYGIDGWLTCKIAKMLKTHSFQQGLNEQSYEKKVRGFSTVLSVSKAFQKFYSTLTSQKSIGRLGNTKTLQPHEIIPYNEMNNELIAPRCTCSTVNWSRQFLPIQVRVSHWYVLNECILWSTIIQELSDKDNFQCVTSVVSLGMTIHNQIWQAEQNSTWKVQRTRRHHFFVHISLVRIVFSLMGTLTHQ